MKFYYVIKEHGPYKLVLRYNNLLCKSREITYMNKKWCVPVHAQIENIAQEVDPALDYI